MMLYSNQAFAASHPLYFPVYANGPDVPPDEGAKPPPPTEVPPPLPPAAAKVPPSLLPAAATSAGAAKKQAGGKTTGLTAADLTPKKKQSSKLFFLGTADKKYTICSDVVGTTKLKIITFCLSGVLPYEEGFLCTLCHRPWHIGGKLSH